MALLSLRSKRLRIEFFSKGLIRTSKIVEEEVVRFRRKSLKIRLKML